MKIESRANRTDQATVAFNQTDEAVLLDEKLETFFARERLERKQNKPVEYFDMLD